MQRHNSLLLIAAVTALALPVARDAFGQSSPPDATAPVVTTARFPAGISPAAETDAEQRFMLEGKTSVANALKDLCATNYGPAELCGGKNRAPMSDSSKQPDQSPGAVAAATPAGPSFVETTIWQNSREGVLRYPDGHEETIVVGRAAESGYEVQRLTRSSVTLKKNGVSMTLPLQSRSAGTLPATVSTLGAPSTLPPIAVLPAPRATAPVAASLAKKNNGLFDMDSPIPAAPKPHADGATDPTK